MSNFGDNPYASPVHSGFQGDPRQRVKGKVMAPAIGLIVVGAIGLVASAFAVVMSLGEPQVDPNAPEFVRQMQQGAAGPAATAIQSGFVLLNLLIIAGAAQMLRFQTWGLAVAASVAAMANFGSCCCILGLPVGIWSIVILMAPDVKAAFMAGSKY